MTTNGRYLFVDGGYLRKTYVECMQVLLGTDGDLDLTRLPGLGEYRRIFYFDCIDDDEKGKDEDEDQYEQRMKRAEALQALFNALAVTADCHVVHGVIKGRRRPRNVRTVRQKEVDVSFAVKALDLAHRREMLTGHLLTGDQDFRPLVQALVSINTKIALICFSRTTPIELRSEADSIRMLTPGDLLGLSTAQFRQDRHVPTKTGWGNGEDYTLQQVGVFGRSKVKLFSTQKSDPWWTWALVVEDISSGRWDAHVYDDRMVLLKYFSHWYGDIQWSEQP